MIPHFWELELGVIVHLQLASKGWKGGNAMGIYVRDALTRDATMMSSSGSVRQMDGEKELQHGARSKGSS